MKRRCNGIIIWGRLHKIDFTRRYTARVNNRGRQWCCLTAALNLQAHDDWIDRSYRQRMSRWLVANQCHSNSGGFVLNIDVLSSKIEKILRIRFENSVKSVASPFPLYNREGFLMAVVQLLHNACGISQHWGHSSVGRALQWHCRGRRFDPAWLHHPGICVTNSTSGHSFATLFRCDQVTIAEQTVC